MLPSQPPFPPSSAATPDASLSFSNLDPLAAKQMAALQAINLAKTGNRYAPGGVSSAPYLGGLSSHHLPHPDSVEPNPSQPPPQAMNPAMQLASQQRRKQFLHGLAQLMLQRGVPLPPQLTGVPYPPGYDPSNSPWRSLDVSQTDIGVFRLAGKEVDLFKFWGFVQQSGGSAKLNQQGGWGSLLPPLELPEQIQQPSGQVQSTAAVLQTYYMQLLGPFEDAYRKNARDQRMQQGRPPSGFPVPGAQGRPMGMGGVPGSFPPSMGNGNIQVPDLAAGGSNMPFSAPQTPMRQNSQQAIPSLGGTPEVPLAGSRRPDVGGMPSAAGLLPDLNGSADIDGEARKRKMEEVEEANGKRARQKTGEPPDLRTNAPPKRTIRQPSRRKIEYVPYARELESAGGRDLEAIQREYAMISRYPAKDFNEWGVVDMEALTLSLRSRLGMEISYALTTFTLLTLLRIRESGFVIGHAPDLFEELLDLVDDVAFADVEDQEEDISNRAIITNRQIVKSLAEDSYDPFGALKPKQGHKDPRRGLVQRPGDILLAAVGIIRNLSVTDPNQEFLAKHDRLLPLLLRMISLKPGTSDTPLSPALSLNDLVPLRKDVVQILCNLGVHVALSPSNKRDARRAFELFASYLVDPHDAVTPFHLAQLSGGNMAKPSTFLEITLDGFTRISQPDANRLVLSKAIPESWLWSLFEALVHRLPVDNNDYQYMGRAEWLGYVERIMLQLYSVSFLASPAFKQRVKADRHLAFAKIFLRFIRKMTLLSPNEFRAHYQVIVRRAVETLKLIDDAEDSFEVSPSTMPTLSFGMGYGEQGEARVEKGMGLFSGYQEEITWSVMMMPQGLEATVFTELSSLVRVQPSE